MAPLEILLSPDECIRHDISSVIALYAVITRPLSHAICDTLAIEFPAEASEADVAHCAYLLTQFRWLPWMAYLESPSYRFLLRGAPQIGKSRFHSSVGSWNQIVQQQLSQLDDLVNKKLITKKGWQKRQAVLKRWSEKE